MVTCGCDTIETCEPATSVMEAPARSAMCRWVAGGTPEDLENRLALVGDECVCDAVAASLRPPRRNSGRAAVWRISAPCQRVS